MAILLSRERAFQAWLTSNAIAHLSISDILLLTVLEMVLGYVYLRSHNVSKGESRNLLSSTLLRSVWSSGSCFA